MNPRRFELSQHEGFGYRVSVPNLLPNHGDRLPVREDIVTEEDRQRVARFLAGLLAGSGEFCQHYVDQADELLALVLGSDDAGRLGP